MHWRQPGRRAQHDQQLAGDAKEKKQRKNQQVRGGFPRSELGTADDVRGGCQGDAEGGDERNPRRQRRTTRCGRY